MDLQNLLNEAKSEPSGIVARGTDGRLFFLPDAEADKFTVSDSTLYSAFRGATPPPAQANTDDICPRIKKWLDTHNPNSDKWRALCWAYFDGC